MGDMGCDRCRLIVEYYFVDVYNMMDVVRDEVEKKNEKNINLTVSEED